MSLIGTKNGSNYKLEVIMKKKLLFFLILIIILPISVGANDFSIGTPKQVSAEIQDGTSDYFLLKWRDDPKVLALLLKDDYKNKVFTQVNIYIRNGDTISIKDITYNLDTIPKIEGGLSQIVLTPSQVGIENENVDLMEGAYSFKIRYGIRMQDILGSFNILGTYSPFTSIGLMYPYNYASPWAIEELNDSVSKELIIDEIKSNMKENITREDFSSLMVNFYEKVTKTSLDSSESPFMDTINPQVSKAFSLGIVSGFGDNTFRPKNSITRQDIAVMIVRTLKIIDPSLDTSVYANDNQEGIKDYAYESLIFLNQKQVFKGDQYSKLQPFKQITREESVLLLLRAMDTFID